MLNWNERIGDGRRMAGRERCWIFERLLVDALSIFESGYNFSVDRYDDEVVRYSFIRSNSLEDLV